MRKQFTILLILIFALGLTPISINKISTVTADECPDITIGSIPWSFRPGEGQAVNGSGFDEGLTVKFNNGKLDGIVSFINTIRIGATPSFSYLEPLRAGNLILTNSCGKTATYAYGTYPVPQITSINIIKNYEYTYNFSCNINNIDSNSKIYPGSKIRATGTEFNSSDFTKEAFAAYLNGKIIFHSTNTYHEISPSCVDFTLPQDTLIGNNYLQIANDKGMVSDKFYFEVSKHNCVANDWKCNSWSICNVDGTQTRECNLFSDCENPNAVKPNTSQSCIPQCREDKWKCGEWGSCSASGQQTRICIKDYDCPLIDSQSPATTQSCAYTPACSADTWQCGNWGTCSPQGIQTRSCNKTYDCPSVETASPTTSQYCQTSNTTPSNTNNEQAANINRNQILKATVKLICPIDKESGWQGSGTIIDQYGSIITNRHVVDGTIGICRVGFIDNASDIPYFSEIADVKKVSSDQSLNGDMAILKIRNNSNKKFTAVDILLGNSDNLKSGDYILPFGYPKEEEFGEAITFTEGPYSGNGTSVIIGKYKYDVSKFFKTTAVIEHGSSGGGAYQKSTGYYMGIPTLGFEKVNYILSANYIKQWINSFDGNYSVARNNFSSISNLYKETVPIESINLNMLKELDSSKNLLNQTSSESSATESEIVIEEEKNLITKIDNSLSKRVSGNILLQVEKNGEGWYVNPDNTKKYYLGRPADAFSIMRNLGLGIKHDELTGYLNKKFPSRLSGKIMLDVERNGEAYYVNPDNLKGYYLNRPADAFRIMRELGLGITNSDIRKIDVGEID